MEAKQKHIGKRIAAGAAGVVMAAGLLVNGAVTDPNDLLTPPQDGAGAPHVRQWKREHPNAILETGRFEPYTLRERACLWLQSLPLPLRAGVLLPLWGVGELVTTVVSALIQSPIGQFLLHLLLELALLIGLFALVWKLLFPHVPLKKLFTKKNLLWMLAGAVVIALADLVLRFTVPNWKVWRAMILGVVGFGVLILLAWRILDRFPLPKRRKERVELVVN